jgi:phosphohistidine phosphatase SixA
MARWWGSKWLKYGVLALLGVGAAAALAPADSWIASTVKGPFDRNHRANWNAWKQENNKLWAERVVAGGYILHFRHAQREKWHDSAAFDAYEAANGIDASTSSFARATCLTEQGVEEAKLIGKVFEMVGVKVAQVFSSPSCRARQTAQYAFGDYTVSNALLARTSVLPSQREDFNKALRKLMLEVELPEGRNVVMTGHGQTFVKSATRVLDERRLRKGEVRRETGFYVIERKDGKLIAHYRFASFREFANALIEVPLEAANSN